MIYHQVARLGDYKQHLRKKSTNVSQIIELLYRVYFKLYGMLEFVGVALQHCC